MPADNQGFDPTRVSQAVLDKRRRCDRLIQEGIKGQRDEVALDRACVLSILAEQLDREDARKCALEWHEALEKRGISGELQVLSDLSRANLIAAKRYRTDWTWDQPTLAREIYYLRRAVSNPAFAKTDDITKCKCLNNLGNRLRVSGRAIEALEYWRRALQVQPRFGMALCNKARILADYSKVLGDEGKSALFLWMAHKEASAAVAITAIYTDTSDLRTRDSTNALKEWIESVVDLKEIDALDPLAWPDTSPTDDERNYRRWCLVNYLFLNPSNDLGPYPIATTDSKHLAGHVVAVDAPHTFESFYDQMKQEYVSARWLLYEGLAEKIPHFSDRDVSVGATEPRPSLSLATEKVKCAYRVTYSLFDKVGFFLANYMELGIPERQITFRSLWRTGENKPMREEFDLTGNWGFCALYWLARDFFEQENDEVAEPQARGLSEIRNHLEHKYLRVTVAESSAAPPDDLAAMVSREQFQAKAMHLLKLARSALIYLAIGVGMEEERREASRGDMPLEEIPITPILPDSEKV